MATDRRIEFIRKWFRRACESDADLFEQFFYAWLALIVSSQRARTLTGKHIENDTDAKRVADYFSINQAKVLSALENTKEQMQVLARRRGTNYSNHIVDSGSPDLREHFRQLSMHYQSDAKLPDDQLISYVAELINRIRNNLFHGVKVYDDDDDIELLQLVNPVLISIIRECEGCPV